MPLIAFLEEFGLDRELIVRDREMSAGLARGNANRANNAESEEAIFLHGMAAATEYRRAGAHSVLLSERRAAAEHFRQAGAAYCRTGNPYGLLMFACADYSPGDLLGPAREFGFSRGRAADRLQLTYLILAAAAGGWDRDAMERHWSTLRGSHASLVGVLGLPVGVYMDLVRGFDSGEPESVRTAVTPFLLAHSNAMARAKDNHYHWRIMAMPFHPAEPDVLSVLFLVEAAMRLRGEKLVAGLLERVPLVSDSANLLHNAVLERFGDPHPGPAGSTA